jgi:hypothetical protein
MVMATLRDLVKEAGINLPDWEPSSNPKYCYAWGFSDGQNAVLTQWYKDIHQERSRVYCEVVPEEVWREFSEWNGQQINRFQQVIDILEQFADSQESLRVVIVSGIKRFKSEGKKDVVKRRMLDPASWRVTRMENRLGFVVERKLLDPLIKNPCLEVPKPRLRKITRIAYNRQDWHHPTGEAARLEEKNSYVVKMGFGHEEWLFRNEWVIDGWRYAFLQGVHKGGKAHENQVMDVDLFTITPEKDRRLVARIEDLECLDEAQSKAIYQRFRKNGWLKRMVEDVKAVGGVHSPLLKPTTPREMFNIRFKITDIHRYPDNEPLPSGIDPNRLKRYLLYDLDKLMARTRTLVGRRGRKGTANVAEASPRTRHPSQSTTFTPEHQNMQRDLMKQLKITYGSKAVKAEHDFIDVSVKTKSELIYYEIKTDLDPRMVIRQALGQILEYAYYPGRSETRQPTKLVLVGRKALDQDSETYLRTIANFLPIPIEYMEITL